MATFPRACPVSRQVGFTVGGNRIESLAATFLQNLHAGEYTFFAAHVAQHMIGPSPDDPDSFEFGLDLILDGIERIRLVAAPDKAGL
jgi:hypothetical protein